MKQSSFCFANKALSEAVYSTGKSLVEISTKAQITRVTLSRAMSGNRIAIRNAYMIIKALNYLQSYKVFQFDDLFKIDNSLQIRRQNEH